MPAFILWNALFESKTKELSFFSTAIQLLYINQGTRDTIAKMLEDLGVGQYSFDRWTVDHFVTDYLLDEPLSDDWRDIWAHTWEIKVHLTEAIKLDLEVTNLVRTSARDDTDFVDELSNDLSAYFPAKYVLIADFYDSESLAIAQKILPMVNLLRDNEPYIEIMRSQVPQFCEKQLKRLRKEYQSQEYFYKRIPEDFCLTRYGWYPDEAEQAFLPPQYHLEINQSEEPKRASVPTNPPFLIGTNISENTFHCQIDREIVLYNYNWKYEFWADTLNFVCQNDLVVDCHLTMQVDWEFYLHILEEAIFGTEKDFRMTLFGGEFLESKELEIEIRLTPDLLRHLLKHASTVDEAAAYILKLGQEKPKHPLIGAENWFCTQVKQSFELEPGQPFESISKGYKTFWHHLSLSDLTMGQADCEQFSQRLTDKYKHWLEAGNGIIQYLSTVSYRPDSDGFKSVGMDIQEAVTEFENLDGEIYPVALKFFTEQGFAVDPYRDRDFFSFDFQGENGEWRCQAEMNEKNQEFFFYSIYPGHLPENRVTAIIELLVRANHYLSLGNFDLSRDNTIRYKTSIRLPGIWSQDNLLNQELLKQLVYTNLKAMDRHWSAIQAILEQDLSVEEALALIED